MEGRRRSREGTPNPAEAYDLYTKLAAVFAGEDLGKSVRRTAQAIEGRPRPVQDELAARVMFKKLYDVIPRAKYEQRDRCRGLSATASARNIPESPTGKKAKALWGAIMGQ